MNEILKEPEVLTLARTQRWFIVKTLHTRNFLKLLQLLKCPLIIFFI